MTIPTPLHLSDRGNTLLVSDDGGLVFIAKLGDSQFLGFFFNPENYPAVDLIIDKGSAKDQRKYIRKHLKGWSIRKWNLDDHAPADKHGCVR